MTVTDTTDLAAQARQAYTTAQAQNRYREMRHRTEQVENIYRALANLNITPADSTPAFVNTVSGQICIPLIAGELRFETVAEDDPDSFDFPVQTHAVAAEWDADARMVHLVADADYDSAAYNSTGRVLYPAGYLRTLADLGEALEHGGRKPRLPDTTETKTDRILGAVNGDLIDAHGYAILAAAEAVCAALADIADAIRAGNRL
ncbi:hypothetical protein [Catenulispora subtropica]|uniref:Uncharacterized protein n=1 Tax=Catenulispora subtropica TaxID=450798 RepID=A0ABP5C165_9ACTN